jgi:hypothetical protein
MTYLTDPRRPCGEFRFTGDGLIDPFLLVVSTPQKHVNNAIKSQRSFHAECPGKVLKFYPEC